ncbi:hypothetical protein QR680_011631 [Steinernema hermaphroditum]|uniref:Uncharacterized protein n=1 Tax=Steinernema hermaphroditum TaxID=289476 RepID=A0AA39HZ60_9BILA|nr:hypothetical protein QR680_011631 [Steinernema hermaphroditum]
MSIFYECDDEELHMAIFLYAFIGSLIYSGVVLVTTIVYVVIYREHFVFFFKKKKKKAHNAFEVASKVSRSVMFNR